MVELRLQQVSDARRFYEILTNPNFIYFSLPPKSIKAEQEWITKSVANRKNNTEWNYTILYNKEVIGAIGIKINYHRKYIGEIGFFVDQKYWGKGIASQAVKLIEKICLNKFKLTRLEIVMQPENTASEKVAIKNGYQKEGLLRKALEGRDGKKKDCYIYAKTI